MLTAIFLSPFSSYRYRPGLDIGARVMSNAFLMSLISFFLDLINPVISIGQDVEDLQRAIIQALSAMEVS